MHGPQAELMHVPQIMATETNVDTFSASQPANGHGPALGVGERWGQRGPCRPPDLEGKATRTINRDFSRSFLRHCNSTRVAAARGQRERDARVTRRPQGAIQRG
jgi:hypothetical protein